MGKRLISEQDIQQAAREGRRSLAAPPGNCIVTPMARDAAAMLGIALEAVVDGAPAGSIGAAGPGPVPDETGTAARLIEEVVFQIRSRLPEGVSDQRLGQVVREVVAARLAPADAASAVPAGPGGRACRIAGGRVRPHGSAPTAVDGKVQLAEVLSPGPACGLAAGILAWEKASFSRQVETDEIDIVIAGQLQVTVDGKTLDGAAGDMIYLPRGAQAVYSTPSSVKLACVNRA